MILLGKELPLYPHEPRKTIRNTNFKNFQIESMEKFYLPGSSHNLVGREGIFSMNFIEDDNRGSILQGELCEIDGTEFFLSVKGVGSSVDPYSLESLNINNISSLSHSIEVRESIEKSGYKGNRFITGETWLRGSPYGGQGYELAAIAMETSEMADPTSINGFRVAPLMSIVFMEENLQKKVRELYWYRRYTGDFVQEIRLVPSNIRLFFHASSTVGNNISQVFDIFQIRTDEEAISFIINFVKSGIAALTVFSRTLRKERNGIVSGLDFFDVWLDKDAVLAKDGTIYFVDLEGVERRYVMEEKVKETITDQFYRSLYEFMYAYVRIEEERERRFNKNPERKSQLEYFLRIALKNDKFVDVENNNGHVELIVKNLLNAKNLYNSFTMLDEVK
jgi:hypothetical protein